MKVSELFYMHNGNGFAFSKIDKSSDGEINFVCRSGTNNGVDPESKVNKYKNIDPFPAGLITVALGGTVLSSFIQVKPFYTGVSVKVLEPKTPMSCKEKLFYAMCIKANAYRYNYGRAANKTLKDIELPDKVPDWVLKSNINFNILQTKNNKVDKIIPDLWKEFDLIDFFDMEAGKYYSKEDYSNGKTPLVSSKGNNNGVMEFTDLDPKFKGNCLTIGKIDAVTFYQDRPFCATSDVTVLIPKFKFNIYIGLFIKTIIELDKYRWCYGRQIRLEDCKLLKIKLPVDYSNGYPNFKYMEEYIRSLPYGDKLWEPIK